MYNVFKRPMFKRGGTPAQGTGIMSHVEYNKYLDDARKKEQAEISSLKNELTSITEQNTQEYARKAKEEADRLAREAEAERKVKIKEGPSKTPGMTKEEEIKSEAGFLKNLLEDKDMNKGEIALVLAEALATPGGFNKKLEKTRALAIPLIRQRGKEDKSYKLEAYKRYKDKEEAFIKYGQPTPYSKNIKTQAENLYKDHLIKTGGKPTKTKEDFEREYYVSNAKDADKQENEAALNNSSRTIIEPAIKRLEITV
jgi:hypothetical protein